MNVNVQVIAWTGGSRPRRMLEISKEERRLRSILFRDQMKTIFEYWGDYRGLNDSVLDMARIQYNRARYDAHATYRNESTGIWK